jgi:hypothetical protein
LYPGNPAETIGSPTDVQEAASADNNTAAKAWHCPLASRAPFDFKTVSPSLSGLKHHPQTIAMMVFPPPETRPVSISQSPEKIV